MSRRYEDAIVECEGPRNRPESVAGDSLHGDVRAQQGRFAEAIAAVERTVAMSDRAPFYLGLLGHLRPRRRAREGRCPDRRARTLADRKYVPPHCMVYIYAGLNDLDRAFEWQARA
jgi:hypothetical protein